MSPKSTDTEIIDMIANIENCEEYRFNTDLIFDFVIDHCKEVEPFKSIESIVEWLCGGSSRKKTITFKPKRQFVKFPNYESAKVYFASRSSSENSEDPNIDVTTVDESPLQWNRYHIADKSQSNYHHQQIINVSTQAKRMKSTAPTKNKQTKAISKRKSSVNKSGLKFACEHCEKSYLQRSSLNRHEKQSHPNDLNSTVSENLPTKRPKHSKNINNSGKSGTAFFTLNGTESTYT